MRIVFISLLFLNQTISKDEESSGPAPGAGNFTEGAVHVHLIRLTGYMVIGFISIMTASLVETIYIGRLGSEELAAISFTFPLVMIMQAISMGLSVGASSVVARMMGIGDEEKAKLLNTHCVVLVMSLSFFLSFIVYFNLEGFFRLLGAQGDGPRSSEGHALSSALQRRGRLGREQWKPSQLGRRLHPRCRGQSRG